MLKWSCLIDDYCNFSILDQMSEVQSLLFSISLFEVLQMLNSCMVVDDQMSVYFNQIIISADILIDGGQGPQMSSDDMPNVFNLNNNRQWTYLHFSFIYACWTTYVDIIPLARFKVFGISLVWLLIMGGIWIPLSTQATNWVQMPTAESDIA